MKNDHNEGPDVVGLAKLEGTPKQDMAAFDELGPKVRAVINFKLGVKWSAFHTLALMRQMRLDPSDPQDDHRMAKMLIDANAKILFQLAVER